MGRLRVMRGLVVGALSVVAGCAAFPAPGNSADRLGQDLFVTATAPIQVPWLAARDAWEWSVGPEQSGAWLPVAFVGGLLLHGGLATLHALDLVATPIHFIAGNGPAEVYAGCELPLERGVAPLGPAAGELALYGAAGVGGVAIAWWFGGTYVPHLFARF